MFCDAALAGKRFEIGGDGLSKVGLGEALRCLPGPPGGYIASGRTFAGGEVANISLDDHSWLTHIAWNLPDIPAR